LHGAEHDQLDSGTGEATCEYEAGEEEAAGKEDGAAANNVGDSPGN